MNHREPPLTIHHMDTWTPCWGRPTPRPSVFIRGEDDHHEGRLGERRLGKGKELGDLGCEMVI